MDLVDSIECEDVDLDMIVKKRKSIASTSEKGRTNENTGNQVGETSTKSATDEVPVAQHVSITVDEEMHFKSMKESLTFYKDDHIKLSSEVITEVPEKLRKINEDAYAPRVVSIGPRHHDKPHLQPMERYKWRCLNQYLERSTLQLEKISQIAKRNEEHVRVLFQDGCVGISSLSLTQMITLDCVFMIELFIEKNNGFGLEESVPEVMVELPREYSMIRG